MIPHTFFYNQLSNYLQQKNNFPDPGRPDKMQVVLCFAAAKCLIKHFILISAYNLTTTTDDDEKCIGL